MISAQAVQQLFVLNRNSFGVRNTNVRGKKSRFDVLQFAAKKYHDYYCNFTLFHWLLDLRHPYFVNINCLHLVARDSQCVLVF